MAVPGGERASQQEIITALCLAPAWQIMFPDGASPFGADRFARWFGATYRVDEPWLDPMRWPFPWLAGRTNPSRLAIAGRLAPHPSPGA